MTAVDGPCGISPERCLTAASDPFVDQPGEKAGVDEELSPLGIECRRGLGGDGFVAGPAFLLELGDIVPDRNQHVAELLQLGLVAHWGAMAGNDDGVIV